MAVCHCPFRVFFRAEPTPLKSMCWSVGDQNHRHGPPLDYPHHNLLIFIIISSVCLSIRNINVWKCLKALDKTTLHEPPWTSWLPFGPCFLEAYPLNFWYVQHHLVGGFNPSEQYYSNGSIIPNIWKIIQMFQTTNQSSIPEVTWTVCKHLPYDPLSGLPRTHSSQGSQASNWHSFASFRWLRPMKLSPALCFNHHLQWDTLRKGSESHRP